MWYWILTSGALTAACLAIPHYLYGGANLLTKGQVSYFLK